MFFHCYFSVFSWEAVCFAEGFPLCSFPRCCSCSLDDYWKRQSFFLHLRVQDSNNLVPSGLITLNKVLASVSASLLTFLFPDFPFLDKRGSTQELRKIIGEAWPHRNAKLPFFNSIKEAIHSKSNNLAVNHSHFQTCFWLEKRERIKCFLQGSSDELLRRRKSWHRRCEIPNSELFRNPGPALGWSCKTSSEIWT